MKPTIDPRYLRELARYTGGDRVMTEALQGAADKITKLEAQLAAAEEKEIATWQTNQAQCRYIDTLHAELGAEREKVRVLREALLRLNNEGRWIDDQWQADESAWDQAEEALQATAPEREGE